MREARQRTWDFAIGARVVMKWTASIGRSRAKITSGSVRADAGAAIHRRGWRVGLARRGRQRDRRLTLILRPAKLQLRQPVVTRERERHGGSVLYSFVPKHEGHKP